MAFRVVIYGLNREVSHNSVSNYLESILDARTEFVLEPLKFQDNSLLFYRIYIILKCREDCDRITDPIALCRLATNLKVQSISPYSDKMFEGDVNKNRKIFVGCNGLSEELVRIELSKFGELQDFYLIRDLKTKELLGHGYAIFKYSRAAIKALETGSLRIENKILKLSSDNKHDRLLNKKTSTKKLKKAIEGSSRASNLGNIVASVQIIYPHYEAALSSEVRVISPSWFLKPTDPGYFTALKSRIGSQVQDLRINKAN